MTRFRYSLAAACPVDLVPAADAICEAMGWGPGTFSVPLTTGKGITHRGTLTRIQSDVAEMLRDPPKEAAPVMSAVVMSIRECSAHDDPAHWREFLTANGLRMAEDDPT